MLLDTNINGDVSDDVRFVFDLVQQVGSFCKGWIVNCIYFMHYIYILELC